MILPIWLWLVICVIILGAGGIAWLRKLMVTDPRSARAAATGNVIADPKLESLCQSLVINHELTMPGSTNFVAILAPLEFVGSGDHVRTPISLVLSERTLGVSYKQGALGNRATVLVNRRDIESGHFSNADSQFSYAIAASKSRSFTFLFQSEADRDQLASWVTASLDEPSAI